MVVSINFYRLIDKTDNVKNWNYRFIERFSDYRFLSIELVRPNHAQDNKNPSRTPKKNRKPNWSKKTPEEEQKRVDRTQNLPQVSLQPSIDEFVVLLWPGRIISRRWLWNDRSWNLLHLGHLSFTVRLRHSLSVFFDENSWGRSGADQSLRGEGVLNGIYYCPLGFRAPCTCLPLRSCYLMFWLRAPILSIVNSSA